jgi:hypothetical protein
MRRASHARRARRSNLARAVLRDYLAEREGAVKQARWWPSRNDAARPHLLHA